MARPFFSRDRIGDFDLFDRHTEVALQKLTTRTRDGHAVDFQDLISRFTLDSATEFLFGHCVDSLYSDLPYPHGIAPPTQEGFVSGPAEDFARAFAEAQYVVSGRLKVGWPWPLLEIGGDKTKASMDIINAYMDPILADAIAKAKTSGKTTKEDIDAEENLLSHLVKDTSG